MFRVSFGVFLIGLALLSGAKGADAGVRNFFSPSVLGDRIAFCTTSNEICGKPVADAWCSGNGFEKAILFQRQTNAVQTATSFVRYIDSDKFCTGDDCKTFAQIKCYSSGQSKL